MTSLQDKMALSLGFQGTQTFFMQYDAGAQPQNDFELVLSNSNAFDVYVSAGLANDPSEFKSDIVVKGQTYVKITSRAFPSIKSSFVIKAAVNGIDFPANNILGNILLANFNYVSTVVALE